MNLTEILTIVAIVLAPAIAILVGRYLDDRKEKKEAKLWVFRTLMATRATPMSQEHIRALNMIDVTFYGNNKKSRKVVDAWKFLLDHFGKDTNELSEDLITQWSEKNQELLIDLLQKMADCLKYDFDKTAIKNTSYFPKGWGEQEAESILIRKGFAEIIKGKLSLPIEVRFRKPDEEGKLFQESIKKYFEGDTPLKIIIMNKEQKEE